MVRIWYYTDDSRRRYGEFDSPTVRIQRFLLMRRNSAGVTKQFLVFLLYGEDLVRQMIEKGFWPLTQVTSNLLNQQMRNAPNLRIQINGRRSEQRHVLRNLGTKIQVKHNSFVQSRYIPSTNLSGRSDYEKEFAHY